VRHAPAARLTGIPSDHVPIYDYACGTCGHRFEVFHGLNEAGPHQCPECGGAVNRVFAPPAIVFKGSGWAKVDRRYSGAPTKKGSSGEGRGGSGSSRESGSTSGGDASRADSGSGSGGASSGSGSDGAPSRSDSGSDSGRAPSRSDSGGSGDGAGSGRAGPTD
jgi:putative FmdB family regulatory protein